MSIVVHHSPGTRSVRVLWVLEEIGCPYEVISEPFPPRTRRPDYLQVNATGTIPALIDGDLLLTESVAICQHLAETHGRDDLQVMPGEADRAAYLQWLWYGEATLSVPLSIAARTMRLPSRDGLEPLLEDVRATAELRRGQIEARLADRKWLVADRFTLADVSCWYGLLQADRFRVLDTLGPATRAYYDRLKARPALQRASAVE
jgi:glutathione S-transferase